MCGQAISNLFGGGRSSSPPPAPPTPAPPAAPPAPQPIQTAPTPIPETPTPKPQETEGSKKKAKITAKKINKKKTRAQGTSQLQTKKPAQGGLSGINTPQGVNTGAGQATTTPRQTT